jgi:hypothetical protein
MKNRCEVADVFRVYGKDYQKRNFLSCKELKTYHITTCRTAKLGGLVQIKSKFSGFSIAQISNYYAGSVLHFITHC